DLEQDRLDHVVADDLEGGVALEMLDVGAFAAEKIVQADDLVPVAQQPLAQMRSQKSRAARHQCSHVGSPWMEILQGLGAPAEGGLRRLGLRCSPPSDGSRA